MNLIIMRTAAAVALAGVTGWAAAQETGEQICVAPGVTVVTDDTGDVTAEQSPQGVPADFADIESVKVAQQKAADGSPQLVFTIKVVALDALTPNSGWFTSFKSSDGNFYGARMVTDITGAESFESYTLNTNSSGEVADGRFPKVITPADASSSYAADGTITVVVPGASIGITTESGASVRQFNAGSLFFANIDYPVDPPDPPEPAFIPGGFGLVLDPAPEDLSRRGTVELTTCSGTAKSGFEKFGGAIGFGLLLPAALLGLRRRKFT